jgi:hypothetical protein
MEIKAGKPAGQTERIELLKQKVADDEQERRLNVRMTKREYRQLQRFAFEQEMKISDVVRKAVAEYMKSKTGESVSASQTL